MWFWSISLFVLPILLFVNICSYSLLFFSIFLFIEQMRVTEVARFLSTLLRSLILVSLIVLSFGWSYSHLLLQVNPETFQCNIYMLVSYWYLLVIYAMPCLFIGMEITKGKQDIRFAFFLCHA